MRYEFFHSGGVDPAVRARWRTALRLERRLACGTPVPPGDRLAVQLAEILASPQGLMQARRESFDWLLSYGTPALIRCLAGCLQAYETRQVAFSLLRRLDPACLLPREHLVPDVQFSARADRPGNVLVVFCGNSLRLNIPVQLFHLMAGPRFDAVVYLRDRSRRHFTAGISPMARSLDELNRWLLERCPEGTRVSVLCTSAGGLAAARFATLAAAGRMAMFSPNLHYAGERVPGLRSMAKQRQLRIFMSRRSPVDAKLATLTLAATGGSAHEWLDTESHGTLEHVMAVGQLGGVLDWLAGLDAGPVNPVSGATSSVVGGVPADARAAG